MKACRSLMCGQSDIPCVLSRHTWQYVTLFIEAVEVKLVEGRMDAASKSSEIVSSCFGVSVPSVTLSIILSKLEAYSEFITLRLGQIRWFVRSGLEGCPCSGVTLPVCRFASNSDCLDCSWRGADLFLAQ